MSPDLAELQRRITAKVAQLDKRIKFRSGKTYFDETERVHQFHSEAYVYEDVLRMLKEVAE